jgi:DNA-directed RNA polymerase specialized sigma subunit
VSDYVRTRRARWEARQAAKREALVVPNLREDQILGLRMEGLPLGEIARMYGVSRQRAHQLAAKAKERGEARRAADRALP